jgi:hypothetical protein
MKANMALEKQVEDYFAAAKAVCKGGMEHRVAAEAEVLHHSS